jgi:ubiquinone/menaquinone biosynthesis C-methylase UbiE
MTIVKVKKQYIKEGNINIYLKDLNPEQKAEDDFFKSSDSESASSPLYMSFLFKIQSILFFDDIIRKYNISFNGKLLEFGGGYGYISAYIKRKFPDVTVIYSDVSKEAVRKSQQYERFFNVTIDEKWITSAEDTPFSDNTIDNILFFASFHHVQDPKATVKECARILKTGGKLYLLFEPSCPLYLKPLYGFYVRREVVKENFYSIGEYKSFFKNTGLIFNHYNYKEYIYRWSKKAMFYFAFLNLVPNAVTNLFPCSQVIIGEKK